MGYLLEIQTQAFRDKLVSTSVSMRDTVKKGLGERRISKIVLGVTEEATTIDEENIVGVNFGTSAADIDVDDYEIESKLEEQERDRINEEGLVMFSPDIEEYDVISALTQPQSLTHKPVAPLTATTTDLTNDVNHDDASSEESEDNNDATTSAASVVGVSFQWQDLPDENPEYDIEEESAPIHVGEQPHLQRVDFASQSGDMVVQSDLSAHVREDAQLALE
jgi:hypothetical protein